MADLAGGAARRRRERHAPLVAASRADDRVHGAGCSPASFSRARDERRSTEPEDGQLQGGSGVLRAARRRTPQGCGRPVWSSRRGPQERVPRHTVEQMADIAPMVQILDAPVPQLVDKLEDVLKIVDLFVPGAGDRSAQDLKPFLSSSSSGSSCSADSKTVGGRAIAGRHPGTWQV